MTTATESVFSVRADEVEFYPTMAKYTLEKAWEYEPYTRRKLEEKDHTVTFIANAAGLVLPTTRRPNFDEINIIKHYQADGFFVFGALHVDALAQRGVHIPADLIAYGLALTRMVQNGMEQAAKPFGIEHFIQKDALPRLE